MTGKILGEILDAEKEASDIRTCATSKAAEMISDAKINGEALCRETKELAEAKKKAEEAAKKAAEKALQEKEPATTNGGGF